MEYNVFMKKIIVFYALIISILSFGVGYSNILANESGTSAPVLSYESLLKVGSRGDKVVKLQTALNTINSKLNLGLAPLVADGVFGSKTGQIVKAIQVKQNLSADGVAGPKTYAQLQSILGLQVAPVNPLPPTLPVNPPTISCLPTSLPSVKIISPNGGEVYNAGQNITVKWETCNIPATTSAKVGIMPVSYQGGTILVSTGAVVPNTGSMNITLPTTATVPNLISGSYYKFHIDFPSLAIYGDDSDNNFSIISGQSGITPTLVWSKHSSNPKSGNIVLKEDEGVTYPVAVYKVKGGYVDAKIEEFSIRVNVDGSGTMNQVSDLVELFVVCSTHLGVSKCWESEGSTANDLTYVEHRFKNVNFVIPALDEVKFEIKAIMTNIDGTIIKEGDELQVSLDGTETIAKVVAGINTGNNVQVTGDIPGSYHTLTLGTSNAIEVTHISSDIEKTYECDPCDPGEGEKATGTFVFKVKALGGDIYIPKQLAKDEYLGDTAYGSGSTFYIENNTSYQAYGTTTSTSNAESAAWNTWKVPTGSTKTFTYKVSTESGMAGNYSMGITSIEWAPVAAPAGHTDTKDYSITPFDDWETDSIFLNSYSGQPIGFNWLH